MGKVYQETRAGVNNWWGGVKKQPKRLLFNQKINYFQKIKKSLKKEVDQILQIIKMRVT